MKIIEIAFFAYAVSDIKKARAFYEGVLGLRPNSEYDGSKNPNWVEYDIATGTLGIGCAPGMWDPSTKGLQPLLRWMTSKTRWRWSKLRTSRSSWDRTIFRRAE